jgi:hypothetical protein
VSAYVVFTHIRTRDWIIDHSTSDSSWRRRVIKGSIGESLVNHMRPDPGRPFMSLDVEGVCVGHPQNCRSDAGIDHADCIFALSVEGEGFKLATCRIRRFPRKFDSVLSGMVRRLRRKTRSPDPSRAYLTGWADSPHGEKAANWLNFRA